MKTGDPRDAGGDKPPLDYAPAVLVRDLSDVETSAPPGKVTVVKKYRRGGKDRTPDNSVSSFKWVL